MTDNPYASIDDIFACSDLREQDVTAHAWRINGKAAKVRVRGMSLATRERIKSESGGDLTKLVAGYIQAGFVNPPLTLSQAEKLVAEKHAGQIDTIAGLINALSEIDYESITAEAKRISGMDDSTEQAISPVVE